MSVSKQARRGARQLFRACLVNGILDETRIREAVRRVVEARLRNGVAILSEFHRLVRLEIEARSARVDSAVPLPQELLANVRSNLVQAYGQQLTVSFAQNPALIGGLRIKVGSDVFDGSVHGRLRALEQRF